MLDCACLAIALASAGFQTDAQVAADATVDQGEVSDEYAAGFAAGIASTPSARRFVEHFRSRDPFYIVFGSRGQVNARLQLSFQYDFIAPDDSPDNDTFWDGLAFAYTQQSLWDLQSQSVPFDDTNYRPSLFWHREAVIGDVDGPRWDFEIGYEHESNGLESVESRSINTLYLRPTYHHPIDDRWEFRTTPKVWAYIGDLSDNPEIADYRGWFDWRLQVLDPQGFGISTNLRKGGESSYGSIQVDLTYPMHHLFGDRFDMFWHLQYFNGYGETLLFYDEKLPAQLRFGFSLVR